MEAKCACHRCQNVEEDPGGIPGVVCDIPEYLLIHGKIGTDIKQVDISQRMQSDIETGGDQAAGKIKQSPMKISAKRIF